MDFELEIYFEFASKFSLFIHRIFLPNTSFLFLLELTTYMPSFPVVFCHMRVSDKCLAKKKSDNEFFEVLEEREISLGWVEREGQSEGKERSQARHMGVGREVGRGAV